MQVTTQIEIATAVRRFKPEQNLSLGTELKRLQLSTVDPLLREALNTTKADLMSITRALDVEITEEATSQPESISISNGINIAINM